MLYSVVNDALHCFPKDFYNYEENASSIKNLLMPNKPLLKFIAFNQQLFYIAHVQVSSLD